MKKILHYTLSACIICCFYACNSNNDIPKIEEIQPDEPIESTGDPEVIQPAEPIELTVLQGEKVDSDNCFAFKMFREVSAISGSNTFFSPLSLNMALGMLYNGASGDTRDEMAKALGMADLTEAEINAYYQKMSQALLEIDPLTEIGIANSIWYREGYPVKHPFIDINQKYFDAMVRALDFNKPDAADTINGWCAEKTNDRIKGIIVNPIPLNVMMYLMNALYFKSKWQNPFDKALTVQEDFTKADNQKIRVNMMAQTSFLPYYADQYLQCVEMPYGNGAFSMVAILPVGNMDIDRLIEYLDNDTWQQVINRLNRWTVALKLPRFKVECELPLNDPVKNTGMKLIFQGGLENISDGPLHVSEIRQKTFVEVNEEGTEAAAVTTIVIITSDGGPPPPPVQFFADRPFLYLIKEKSTGTILFIGRMDAPEE